MADADLTYQGVIDMISAVGAQIRVHLDALEKFSMAMVQENAHQAAEIDLMKRELADDL